MRQAAGEDEAEVGEEEEHERVGEKRERKKNK